MSVPSQSAAFSLALQPKKYGDDKAPVNELKFFRTRAPAINLGTQDMADVFPPETGGPIVPTGAYKIGQMYAGEVQIIPRLEEFIGFIFYGALGKIESATDSVWNKATNSFSASVGVNAHRFTMDANNPFFTPWMAVRRSVPGATPDKVYGEVGQDTKIANVQLNIPSAGLLGMTVGFQGRKAFFPTPAEVNAWQYENSSEDSITAATAGKGVFLIGGQKYPINQAAIMIENGMSNFQQEMVVGSFHPDDIVPLSRRITLRIVYKWDNPELYRQILTNGVDNVDWSNMPFIQDTAGGTKAFEARFEAPANIPGTSVPYSMSFIANRVTWQVDRQGLALEAGNIITVPYIGTVLEPLPGQEYFEVILHNKATYTIPADTNTPIFTFADSLAYSGSAVALDAAATLTDDDANFEGGTFNVLWAGGDDFDSEVDRFSFGAGVTIASGVVTVGATAIGTIAGVPGIGQNIGIALNASATPALIQTLLRAIQYNPSPLTARTGDTIKVRVLISDGDGAYASQELVIEHS